MQTNDQNKNPEAKGKRNNEGKLRYDLVEPHAMRELVKVFTGGAKKYDDNNWLNGGMDYSKMLASLKRHIAAFELGEDYDPEMSQLVGEPVHHMAMAAWNALGIVSYSRWFPENDDRLIHKLWKNDDKRGSKPE